MPTSELNTGSRERSNSGNTGSETRRRMRGIASLCALLLAISVVQVFAQDPAGKDLAQFYMENCVRCHGPDGSARTAAGKPLGSHDLTDPQWQKRTPDEEMVKAILKGKFFGLAMPGFKKQLTEDEAQRMVTEIIRTSEKGKVIGGGNAKRASDAAGTIDTGLR